ncbi:MAG: YjbH domain-containing protein [Gemmatimonadetes bacterium]|nr:YjbH domain-containing protein [Gemmatimonadota bacterium]
MTPPLLAPLVPLLLASAPAVVDPGWCGARFAQDPGRGGEAPSLAGLPGLMQVPSASALADRSVMMALNTVHTHDIPGAVTQRNAFLGFGLLPRLSVVARGTSLTNGQAIVDAQGRWGLRDRTASVQWLALDERKWRPAVAAGIQDIGGNAAVFKARYLVAGKSVAGRVRLTAGYGQPGSYSLDGAFGGVEVAPCRWLTIMAEHDGRFRSAGVRVEPAGALARRVRLVPSVDVLWREGDGRVLAAGFRWLPPAPRSAGGAVSTPARPAALAPLGTRGATGEAALVEALVAHGFENVRAAWHGDTVDVTYENRLYNREEWDALGVVLAEMAARAGDARLLRATVLRVDLPVLQVAVDREVFRQFVDGALGDAAFADRLVVRHPGKAPVAGAAANWSRFHADVTVRPRVDHMLLSEISVAEARAIALPEATVQLGRGVSVTGRKTVVLGKTRLFPDGYVEANADQLAVHVTRPGFPFVTGGGGVLTQVSVGQFAPRALGAALSTDMVLGDGRWSVGGVAAAFGRTFTALERSVLVGSVRYRHAPLDLAASVSAGRYFHGDVGATAELERRFGLLEVALFARATETAKIAGYRVSLPLTGRRDARPGAVRVRLPEYYDFTHWKTVLDPVIGLSRTDVGVPLQTGQELVRGFRMRDRLNAVRLGRDVALLREGARRVWAGPEGGGP